MFISSPFSRYSELFVHGLGAAIHRAINLALQLKETSSHTLEVGSALVSYPHPGPGRSGNETR